jgi:hypothetical protein
MRARTPAVDDVWTPAALREYIDARCDALERAVDKAEHVTEAQARATRQVLGLGLTAATLVTSALVVVVNLLT